MFIPIYLALLCIISNLYCGDSLIHYPYAAEGLACSELRADCTDYAKSIVRDIQRTHTVVDIADNLCCLMFGACTLGYLQHYCAPNMMCDEACNAKLTLSSYVCCLKISFIRCVEKCCERKPVRWTFRSNQALKAWAESPTYRPLPHMLSAINIEE
jgi:hypothetical protein